MTDAEDDGLIRAPWTDEQVQRLNAWQELPYVHEYTCGVDSSHSLVATTGGWVCMVDDCPYTQHWALSLSAEEHQPWMKELFPKEMT
jgi:hypothetical protein